MNETVLKIAASLKRIGKGIFDHIQRHSTLFLVVLSLMVVTLFYLQIRTATPPEQFILFTGPAGGGGEKLGKILSEKLRPPGFWSLNQRNVELVIKATEGYEDNRQRIQDDTTGRQIAFAHDGFNPHRNVRVLLPLQESYTHIIVNQGFLKAARDLPVGNGGSRPAPAASLPNGSAGRPWYFEDLKPVLAANGRPGSDENPAYAEFEKWAKNKVFLGPELSGTRQVAKLILEHHGIPVDRLDCEADYNWNEMVSALIRGDIQMAFITTEPGNRAVRRLAGRGGFALLGLRDTEGLCQANSHVAVRYFKKYVYGASQNAAGFCPAKTPTIATRRVLVCSSHMENADAYWLAQRLTEALRSEIPVISWETAFEPKPEQRPLTYHIHPGVEPIKDPETPWYTVLHAYVPSMFWPLILSTAMALVLFALQWINDLLSSDDAKPDGQPVQSSTSPPDSGETPSDGGTNGTGGPEPVGSPSPQLAATNGADSRRQPAAASEGILVATNGHSANGQPNAGVPVGAAASATGTKTAASADDGDNDSGVYRELVAQLNSAIHDINREGDHSDRLPPQDYRRWQRRIRTLKRSLAAASREGHFDDDQREILAKGIGELEWELELLRPNATTRSP